MARDKVFVIRGLGGCNPPEAENIFLYGGSSLNLILVLFKEQAMLDRYVRVLSIVNFLSIENQKNKNTLTLLGIKRHFNRYQRIKYTRACINHVKTNFYINEAYMRMPENTMKVEPLNRGF